MKRFIVFGLLITTTFFVFAQDIDAVINAKEVERIEQKLASDEMRTLNGVILELASSLAAREGAELHIVHAWSVIGETVRSLSKAKILSKHSVRLAGRMLRVSSSSRALASFWRIRVRPACWSLDRSNSRELMRCQNTKTTSVMRWEPRSG